MVVKTWQKIAVGYGGFCVANLALSFLTGNYFRTQVLKKPMRQLGDSALLDFNDVLLQYNLLARFVPESYGPEIPSISVSSP